MVFKALYMMFTYVLSTPTAKFALQPTDFTLAILNVLLLPNTVFSCALHLQHVTSHIPFTKLSAWQSLGHASRQNAVSQDCSVMCTPITFQFNNCS